MREERRSRAMCSSTGSSVARNSFSVLLDSQPDGPLAAGFSRPSGDRLDRNFVELDRRSAFGRAGAHGVEGLVAAAHRFFAPEERDAHALPGLAIDDTNIFAPSRPGGGSPESTSARTMLIASSTLAGSLSNVATRAYMSPPGIESGRGQLTLV
jgi:hypothetical protein